MILLNVSLSLLVIATNKGATGQTSRFTVLSLNEMHIFSHFSVIL